MVFHIPYLIRRPPADGSSLPYRPYTRDFDRVVNASELDRVLGRVSTAAASDQEQAWRVLQGEMQGWRTRVALRALEVSETIRERYPKRPSTAVSILVDQSGSMRGQSMLLAAAAVDVAQDWLSHLDCKVEILGFTTQSWRGGRSRLRWNSRLRPPNPGRLCDLLHIVYRPASETCSSAGGWDFRAMLRPDLPKENVDGEAVEWAANRLRAMSCERRILLVVSDGAPVDDSTLEANDLEYLDRHLKSVIAGLTANGDIDLAAVGIGFDVSRYYRRSAVVQVPNDLGTAMIELIGDLMIGSEAEGSKSE